MIIAINVSLYLNLLNFMFRMIHIGYLFILVYIVELDMNCIFVLYLTLMNAILGLIHAV